MGPPTSSTRPSSRRSLPVATSDWATPYSPPRKTSPRPAPFPSSSPSTTSSAIPPSGSAIEASAVGSEPFGDGARRRSQGCPVRHGHDGPGCRSRLRSSRHEMSTMAQRDSATAKAPAGTSLRRGGAEPVGKERAPRVEREGLAVGVAVILVLNPWVEALPVPSRPGATAHRAALPAPPGDLPTTRVDPSALPQAGAASAARLKEAVGKLPLYFIENRGQADPRGAYYVQGAETSVYFTRAGITYALSGPAKAEAGGTAPAAGEAAFRPPVAAGENWAGKPDFVGAKPRAKP